jgi:hypothetical protein
MKTILLAPVPFVPQVTPMSTVFGHETVAV